MKDLRDLQPRKTGRLAALGLIATGCVTLGVACYGTDEPQRTIEVTVPAGSTFDSVLDTLVTRGVVNGRGRFRLYARLTGADRQIR